MGTPRRKHQRQQHAATPHSGSWLGFGCMLRHAAAAEFFTWRTFFFHSMLKLQTLCCTCMYEQDGGLVFKVLDSSLKGPRFNSQCCQIFCLSVLLCCSTDFRFFCVSVPCQLLRLLPLLRHLGPLSTGAEVGKVNTKVAHRANIPPHRVSRDAVRYISGTACAKPSSQVTQRIVLRRHCMVTLYCT